MCACDAGQTTIFQSRNIISGGVSGVVRDVGGGDVVGVEKWERDGRGWYKRHNKRTRLDIFSVTTIDRVRDRESHNKHMLSWENCLNYT